MCIEPKCKSIFSVYLTGWWPPKQRCKPHFPTTYKPMVSFKQEKWLKPYIDFNTEKRTKAQNDFEKDFYKLMNNAVFGKTMENLRNRVDIHFVTNNEKWGKHATKKMSTLEKKIASPLYNGHIIYNESLTAIKMNKKAITLNKPIYCGMAILDLSKLHMFRFTTTTSS